MLGRIVRHDRENVELHTLASFAKKVEKEYGAHVCYDENNRGMWLYSDAVDKKRLVKWRQLAEDMGWFDEAEVVTDRNDNDRVMTWLNIG